MLCYPILYHIILCSDETQGPRDLHACVPPEILGPSTMKSTMDSLRGSSVNIGAVQRRLAWPLRKDDTHKSMMKSTQMLAPVYLEGVQGETPACLRSGCEFKAHLISKQPFEGLGT